MFFILLILILIVLSLLPQAASAASAASAAAATAAAADAPMAASLRRSLLDAALGAVRRAAHGAQLAVILCVLVMLFVYMMPTIYGRHSMVVMFCVCPLFVFLRCLYICVSCLFCVVLLMVWLSLICVPFVGWLFAGLLVCFGLLFVSVCALIIFVCVCLRHVV